MLIKLVPVVGLEPTSLTARDFKSPMFTNFITRALKRPASFMYTRQAVALQIAT